MARLTTYNNSIFASIVSILGTGMMLLSMVGFLANEWGVGIVFLLLGIGMTMGAAKISEEKAFQAWWKQVRDANLEPEISKSVQVAVDIYNKNPRKQTLEKIRELNPAAAAQIERGIAK